MSVSNSDEPAPDPIGGGRTMWDAVVIGAGPAGSLAARLAALSGLRTLLVDAKGFPREKVCGGYLNGRALHVLQQLQLDSLAFDCRSDSVRELELIVGHKRTRLPLPAGRVICRAEFDASLAVSARLAGATFLTGTQAIVEPALHKSRRRVVLVRNGQRKTLSASVVICADGLARTSVRQFSEFAGSTRRDSRIGMGAVVHGDAQACPRGQIKMIVSPHAYVGISRVGQDRLNVAAAVESGLLSRAAPAQIVSEIMINAGVIVPAGFRTAHWQGTPPLTSPPQHVASERVFLIGDASGYVEPFTGEGMAAGLETAVAVMPFVLQAVRKWGPSLAACWETLHGQIVRDRQATCRHLAWVLRRPWATSAALGVCRAIPAVAGRLISRTNMPSSIELAPGIGPL